jgi:long-chain acyl-CoA synthetase
MFMNNSKILAQIALNAKNFPQKIALIGDFDEVSYSNLQRKISDLAAQLKQLPSQKIALIADNSLNWVIFDLACIEAGLTLIPLPHFFTKLQISEIIESEKISAVFCDNLSLVQQLLPNDFVDSEKSYLNFLLLQKPCDEEKKSQICKITFTSGSTSNPKPVALTTENIDAVVFSLLAEIGAKNIEKNLVILPLSILLENLAGVYLPLVIGGCAVVKSLKFIGISNSSSLDISAFCNAISTTNPTSFILSPELAKLLINLVLAQKISAQNFKFIAVGGAKVASDLLVQAHQLKIPLFEGYGLSEATSVVALNSYKNSKNGSVGKVLSHLEVKISDGEILVKGDSLAQNIALDDEGFYATGDLGYLDEEGFLFISGRKKNIFITSMMRNVNPEWVESEILKSFLIAQVAVFGEAMPYNSAVVVVANAQISFEQIKIEFEKINRGLPDYAQVRNIILATEPFSQKNNMLTGNGRIKRQNIWEKYQKKIKNL